MSKIDEAIVGMLTDVEAITKDRKNQQQGFMFRGIDDVYSAIHPLLAKHGLYLTSAIKNHIREERTTKTGGTLLYSIVTMEYTIHCKEDGATCTTEVIGEGMDSGDKATNKAMSIAFKYALFQLLCIPTEAVDADETTPPPSTKKEGKPEKSQKVTKEETKIKAEKLFDGTAQPDKDPPTNDCFDKAKKQIESVTKESNIKAIENAIDLRQKQGQLSHDQAITLAGLLSSKVKLL